MPAPAILYSSKLNVACLVLVLCMVARHAGSLDAVPCWDVALLLCVGASLGVMGTLLTQQYQFYVHYAWWRAKCWVRHHWPGHVRPAVSARPASRRTMPPPAP